MSEDMLLQTVDERLDMHVVRITAPLLVVVVPSEQDLDGLGGAFALPGFVFYQGTMRHIGGIKGLRIGAHEDAVDGRDPHRHVQIHELLPDVLYLTHSEPPCGLG